MEFCPHCMKPASGERCPSCGGQIQWTAQAGQLPLGSLLRGSDGHTYQVGAARGQGGFGITYAAMNLNTAQRVAIKEYYPTRCAQRTQLHQVTPLTGQDDTYKGGMKSFLEEAMMLSAVGALPSVVTVKDYFESNGTAYLVMEYVDGVPLHQIVKERGKMSAGELLPKLPALLQDLDTLHRAGIIHRDISPDNLILTPEGTLKLLDFGAARSVQDGKSMTVLLKAGFSPVEQYQSRGQGPWTDVYALAGTIYYCLTGTLPPSAIDRLDNDTLQSPNTLGAGLTKAQEEALLWGLTVQPKSRPASMEVFQQRLCETPLGKIIKPILKHDEKDPGKTVAITDNDRADTPIQSTDNSHSSTGDPALPRVNPLQALLTKIRAHKKPVIIGAAALVALILIVILISALVRGGTADDPDPTPSADPVPTHSMAPSAAPTAEPSAPTVSSEPVGVYGTTADGYEYMITADRTECHIVGYNGNEQYVYTPDEIDGIPITLIAKGAFADNTVMESIWVPLYLERIEFGAFEGCSNLRDMYIYSDIQAPPGAFSGCQQLRCVVPASADISVSRLGLPANCEVLVRGMDTGTSSPLDYVEVDDDGNIYAICEDDRAVLMRVNPECSVVTIPDDVVWVNNDALTGVDPDTVIYMPDNLLFHRTLAGQADWQMPEDRTQFSRSYNYLLTCHVCNNIAAIRNDGTDISTTKEMMEAVMIRAEELAESYEFTRPDGSKWSTILDECGVDWSYASTWRSQLPMVDGQLDSDALYDKLQEIMDTYALPEEDNDNRYYTDFAIGLYYDDSVELLYVACFAIMPG